MRLSSSLLVSIATFALVEAGRPGGNAGNARNGNQIQSATSTIVPHEGVLPFPTKLARRHDGPVYAHGRALNKRQTAASDVPSDGTTASQADPGQSDDVGYGIPAECESACQPFSQVVIDCGQSARNDDVSCECRASVFQAFADCASCAPAMAAGYIGGVKGFVNGALEECKAAGITVDYDTSNLPGSGETTFDGPTDDELSASAASASSALAAAGGSASEVSATPKASSATPTGSSKSSTSPSASASSSSSSSNSTSSESGNGAATAGRKIEGTVAAAGLAAIALAAFAGLL